MNGYFQRCHFEPNGRPKSKKLPFWRFICSIWRCFAYTLKLATLGPLSHEHQKSHNFWNNFCWIWRCFAYTFKFAIFWPVVTRYVKNSKNFPEIPWKMTKVVPFLTPVWLWAENCHFQIESESPWIYKKNGPKKNVTKSRSCKRSKVGPAASFCIFVPVSIWKQHAKACKNGTGRKIRTGNGRKWPSGAKVKRKPKCQLNSLQKK